MLKTIFLTLIMITFLYSSEQKNKSLEKEKQIVLRELNQAFTKFDNQKVLKLYKKLANIYKQNGEYYKSVRYYKLALKLSLAKEKQDNKEKIALYHDIGYCYKKIGNNYKTFKYTYLATKLASKTYGKNSKLAKKLQNDIEKIQSRLIASSIY